MPEFALALVPRHIGLMPGVRMKLYIVEVFNQVLAVNRKDHRRWVLAMRSNRDLPGGFCQVNGVEQGVELLQWMPGDLDPEFKEGQGEGGEGGEGGSTMSRGGEDHGEDVDAMDEDRSKVVNAMHDMTISDEEEGEEREKTPFFHSCIGESCVSSRRIRRRVKTTIISKKKSKASPKI